ncbi:hypothetical protein MSKU15_1457 [Komagataeibacter diospyri]|uniref:hypothetical protein n=1 Tax=Komagataeibacter diospyri TaxID=1932662 RepID=UPI00113F84DC|nr:hypothetical protein [Komagataeibacter diospyri]GCE89856.1 hypothetical protein MSKU15_1457 [Komagataeibacter diospyri]
MTESTAVLLREIEETLNVASENVSRHQKWAERVQENWEKNSGISHKEHEFAS